MCNEDLEEMVGHFIHLFDLLNVRSNDCFLLLEHSDRSVDFDVHQLPIERVINRLAPIVVKYGAKSDLPGTLTDSRNS